MNSYEPSKMDFTLIVYNNSIFYSRTIDQSDVNQLLPLNLLINSYRQDKIVSLLLIHSIYYIYIISTYSAARPERVSTRESSSCDHLWLSM